MKSKWNLFASIFQLIVGVAAVIAFFIVLKSGENMIKWNVTFVLAIIFIGMGIAGIIKHFKSAK